MSGAKTGPGNRCMWNVLLLASKKDITRKRLAKDSPTVDHRIKAVQDIFIMEKLTFILKLEQDKFESYWKFGPTIWQLIGKILVKVIKPLPGA